MLLTLAMFPSITIDIVTIVFSALIVTELLNTLTMVSSELN
jgi:hypothetical protein